MLGTQTHLFKGLVLPTFTYGTKTWGGDLKKFTLEGFQEGHEDGLMLKCYLSYFVDKIWRTSHRIIHS